MKSGRYQSAQQTQELNAAAKIRGQNVFVYMAFWWGIIAVYLGVVQVNERRRRAKKGDRQSETRGT